MTRNTRKTTTTALAAAIAAAILTVPVAYSGGTLTAFAKRGVPVNPQQAVEQSSHDSFIVSYHKGTRASAAAHGQTLANASRALGMKLAAQRDLATGARLIAVDRKLDRTDAKRLAIELLKDPSVRAVEPNGRMYRAFTPNDPQYAQQWHYKNGPGGINLEPAWDDAQGDGIVVAVLDTGSTPHSELVTQYVPGYDFDSDGANARDGNGRDSNPNDEGDWTDGTEGCGPASPSSWHGTHVAGTVAAATDNNAGVAGVAFDAKVQPVRVLGRCGGTFVDIAEAIIWASGGEVPGVPDNTNPAEIINLSLGGGGSCAVVLQDAVDEAIGNGSTVVVAAGNSASDAANFQPASCDGVIAVSATGPTGALSGFSNFGAIVSVAAPGGSGANPAQDNILSTLNAGTTVQAAESYAWYAGTSMSSPHVAGVAALIQDAAPTPRTPAQVKKILENTAYAANGFVPGCGTLARQCGAGIVDAALAVDVANGTTPLPPDPPEPPPPTVTELENGVPVPDIDLEIGEQEYYVLDVPAGATNVTFTTTGTDPDADLYVRRGELPTLTTYACRGFTNTSNETCSIANPQAGEWFVMVSGYTQALDVTLTGTHNGVGGGEAPTDLTARYAFPLKLHRNRVPLTWEGGDGDQVDIRFDGAVVATVDNDGSFTHTFTRQGTGTVTYQVCNAGTTECSEEVDVDYKSRP